MQTFKGCFEPEFLAFDKDLLVASENCGKRLHFFKLEGCGVDEECFFKRVYSYEITRDIKIGFHIEMIGFKRLAEGCCELRLLGWTRVYEGVYHTLLSLKFELLSDDAKKNPVCTLISRTLYQDHLFLEEINAFTKSGSSAIYVFGASRLKLYHIKLDFDVENCMEKFQKYRYKKPILNAHILDKKLYLVVLDDDERGKGSQVQKRIDLCCVKGIKEGGFVSKKRLEKSYEVGGKSSKIYFDEITNKVRVFAFTLKKESGNCINLTVLDQRLDVSSEFYFRGVTALEEFEVIDSQWVFIRASRQPKIFTKENKIISLLVDLEGKVAKEVAYLGGEPLLSAPKLCGDGRFLAFQKTIQKQPKHELSLDDKRLSFRVSKSRSGSSSRSINLTLDISLSDLIE